MSMATGSNMVHTQTSGFGKNRIPKGFQKGQFQQFTPQQMQLFQSMFSHIQPGSYLNRLAGGDEGMFEQMEAPAWKALEQSQGQLASRFSGIGTGGQRSSGFQNAQGQLSSDFAQQLQANRMGLQRQALQDLFGMSQGLLSQRPYEQFITEKPKPWWQSLLGGVSQGIGSFGSIAGGLWGGKKLGIF